jgi:hypothetical protein
MLYGNTKEKPQPAVKRKNACIFSFMFVDLIKQINSNPAAVCLPKTRKPNRTKDATNTQIQRQNNCPKPGFKR